MRWAALAATCLTVAGCATGPTLQQSQASIPQLSPDRGRIYFYRPSSALSAAVQPQVRLDGLIVGQAVPGGVFYCDVVPGQHAAAVTTEVQKVVKFEITAGNAVYIKMDWGFGFITGRILFEVMQSDVGAQEAAKNSLLESECPNAQGI